MKTIKLSNGSTAVDFTGEDSNLKAIVHHSTLRQIVANMDRVPTREIIRKIISDLSENENNLKACVELMECSVNFHRTVNLIETWDPNKMSKAEKAMLAGVDISAGIKSANDALESDADLGANALMH